MAVDVIPTPHQLIASDRVEGTAVRRPNGEMIGHIERLMIDKTSGKFLTPCSASAGSSAWEPICCRCPGASCSTIRFEAYELDVEDEELKRAPSFRADKDFDWGDRSPRRRSCIATTAYRPIGAALTAACLIDVLSGIFPYDFEIGRTQNITRRRCWFSHAGKRRVCESPTGRRTAPIAPPRRPTLRRRRGDWRALESGRPECLQ